MNHLYIIQRTVKTTYGIRASSQMAAFEQLGDGAAPDYVEIVNEHVVEIIRNEDPPEPFATPQHP